MSTGNKFACDCRLSWIHILRNETKSKRLRIALDRLNCVVDPKNKGKLIDTNLETTTLGKNDVIAFNKDVSKDNFEENDGDDFEEDKMYEDTPLNLESVGVQIEVRKKLLGIPYDMLPCPQKSVHSGILYSPPTQDEVKYYKASSGVTIGSSLLSLAFLMMLNVL